MPTIIIPTYKEAENIKALVPLIRSIQPDTTILVVDDNSPDGTGYVASSLGCKVLMRENKGGLASAILDGIKALNIGGTFLTTDKRVVVLDADNQHDPNLIPRMLEELEVCDIVVASRNCKGGRTEGWSISRRFVSRGAQLLAYPLCPEIKDRTSGFFAINKYLVNGIELNPVGYKALLEILIKTKHLKPRIVEIPFTFKSRVKGKSKLNLKQYFTYLEHLWRLYRWKLIKGRS